MMSPAQFRRLGRIAQADSLVMIGLMGPVEVPFLLKRVGDAWKVVPQKYFEMLRQSGAI